MIGHDYPQIDYLAAERMREYQKGADAYRQIAARRRAERAAAANEARNGAVFARWLGTLLLEIGRRMRERSGDVVVRIAFQPRGRDRAA